MQIRQATETDIPEIGRLFSRVYTTKEFNGFTPEKATETASWLFKRCPEVAFVAMDNDKIVGAHLAAIKPWFDGPHLVDGEIFVDENYRNKGVGLALTQRWLEAAKELGVTTIDGITFVQSDQKEAGWDIQPQFLNLAWHEKNGFHLVSQMAVISGDIDTVISKTKERLEKKR